MKTPMTLAAAAAAFAALMTAAVPAQAQDYGAMIQQSMARMNAIVGQAEQRVNGAVQQRMQDPAVQAAWQQYVARSGGRPSMNYATFTYYYIYTNGFSAGGMAHMRATESGIQQREMQSWQGLRQAEAQRGAAQQQQRDAYFANQQEAGRGLMGQSTYTAPNGYRLQLPHTWQPNTTVQYQGANYHVDAGGRYYVQGNDGWWYPLAGSR
ncbi:MAG: hypothetical protein LCI02_17860 [Proteobacteria bacterium]|nr:hypothetical protein [Pseudomonadota bacterium]